MLASVAAPAAALAPADRLAVGCARSLHACTWRAPSREGAHQAQRTLVRGRFTARRPRLPVPPPPGRADAAWKLSRDRLLKLNDYDLRASGVADGVRLCEAALAIATHPAQFGVHPADAEQAVRIFYAA